MKKLFTLLTLLVALVTSAWADVEWNMANWSTSHTGLTYWASGSSADIPSTSTDSSTPSWADASTYNTYTGTGGSSTFQLKNDVLNGTNRVFSFTVAANDVIKVYFMGGGNGNRSMYVSYNASTTNRDTNTAFGSATADGYTPTILSATATTAGTVYLWCDANVRVYAIKVAASTAPSISASPSSITLAATESGVAVNSSFTITGSNLTAGTYNLNIPSVSGLTVSPTSFTVAANGTVSQVINVSYSSTVNVPANTANITATVNEKNLSVDVNYSASVASWTLQTINTAKTWDFSTLSGGKQYSGDDLNVEHVYANIAEITCPAGFDDTALAFTGEFPLRSGKGIAQNGTLKFNTSVPGFIVVKFSDTGTSASATATKRYLVVNGDETEYWASREKTGDGAYAAQLNVTTGAIAVPAGDVTISGSSALVYSKLDFTPSVPVTIAASGYSTFASEYALDLGNLPDGLTAYKITDVGITGSTITPEQVTTPAVAGSGLLLKGTPSTTYNIPIASAAGSTLTYNRLVGVTDPYGLTIYGDEYYYILKNGQFYHAGKGVLAKGKAYLALDSAPSAPVLSIDFGGTTSISEELRMKSEEFATAPVYNLNGQRVANPTKGLYIVNGKKVIIK